MRLCHHGLQVASVFEFQFVTSLFIMSFTPMTSTIALMAELPETLHEALTQYVEKHPDWNQDRAIAAALSLFLRQGPAESVNDRCVESYEGPYETTIVA